MADSKPVNPAESLFIDFIRNNAIELFLIAPSLPLVVFLRRKIGYRILKPLLIYFGFITLNTFVWFSLAGGAFNHANLVGAGVLALVNLAFVCIAIYWRIWGKKEMNADRLWHSKSRGVSYINFLPVSESILQRFIEPALAVLVGGILCLIMPICGVWLIVAGLTLLVLEQLVYDMQLNNFLDQCDSMIDGKVTEQISERFGEKGDPEPLSIEETSGVAVSLSPSLLQSIERRKALAKAKALEASTSDSDAAAVVKATEI